MATYFGASELDEMIAMFGVPVVVGGTSGMGIVDITDPSMLPANTTSFVGHQIFVQVKTGFFAGLAEGASISVEGVAYRVVAALQIDDGALTRVQCARLG